MSAPTVHHAAVTVSELDRAVEFYTDTFGFDVAAEFAVGGDAFADAVGVPGASGSFVHLDGGDAVVELVEYDPSGEPTAEASLDRPGRRTWGSPSTTSMPSTPGSTRPSRR